MPITPDHESRTTGTATGGRARTEGPSSALRTDVPVRQPRPAIEPAPRTVPRTAPRRTAPEPDYASPTPVERARLLRAAFEASAGDPEQHLLLAELMAHYRSWCLRTGAGDPFAGEFRSHR